MNPFLLALIMLVVGLAICGLSRFAEHPTLVRIGWWLGLLVFLCGAFLLALPVLIFIATNLKSALGA